MVTRRRSGVTFIESVVVGCILVVVAGILLPAILKVRGSAAAEQCANKMRNMGMAMHAIQNAFEVLPPLCVNSQDTFTASDPPAVFPYATLSHPDMGLGAGSHANQSRSAILVPGPFQSNA